MTSTASSLSGTPPAPSNALVVGGSTSIGEAVVRRLVDRGMRVLATAHASRVDAPACASLSWARLDLADAASLDRFADGDAPRAAPFDLVVFLAGVLPGKALSAYDDALMQQVMTVNFTGQAALLRRLLPLLRDGSQVIMVSSVSGERGSFDPVYAASKAAQIAFVKSLSTWLAPRVRVNAIAPALIEDSSMFNAMAPERRAHHIAQTPTRRLTTRDEIAGVIASLCEPAWANLNGQVIRINGGAHV